MSSLPFSLEFGISFWIVAEATVLAISAAIVIHYYLQARPNACVWVVAINAAIAIVMFAKMYQSLGLISPDGRTVDDFLSCLYFSLVTWTTLGYGDFQPSSSARAFAATEALLGYVVMSFVIAFMLSLLQELKDASVRRKTTGLERRLEASIEDWIVPDQDSL